MNRQDYNPLNDYLFKTKRTGNGGTSDEYTVPKDVDTEQEGMGKNRENTVQMKILSGTKKTFS